RAVRRSGPLREAPLVLVEEAVGLGRRFSQHLYPNPPVRVLSTWPGTGRTFFYSHSRTDGLYLCGDRGQVRLEEEAVVLVHDLLGGRAGAAEPLPRRGLLPGDRVRPGHRLVGEGKVELLDLVAGRLTQLEAAAGVMERRLGTAEHGIDAGALPLAACVVGDGSGLRPVVGGGVRTVEQLIRLLRRSHARLQESPRLVEQLDAELPIRRRHSPPTRPGA